MAPLPTCNDILTAYPINLGGVDDHSTGLFMIITAAINVIMSLVTIGFIKYQEKISQSIHGNDFTAKSVIFPVFVHILWISAFCNFYSAILYMTLPLNPPLISNSIVTSFSYAVMWSMVHGVIEGIAFLLLQKGCGKYAAIKAIKLTFIWVIITFVTFFFIFHLNGVFSGAILELIWDFLLLSFFFVLWLAPQKLLFRRPAAIAYSKFWFIFRLFAFSINILLLNSYTTPIGTCLYIFLSLLLFSIFQPLICYYTLLQDSYWWQGLDISQGGRRISNENIRSPLVGSDFSLMSAQNLATTMDNITNNRVQLLNFACIKLDLNRGLGSGSFSKVFAGSYKGKECAVKLIYTVDLTAEIISRIAAEASILSSINHNNVVKIIGVSVLPPAVCLLLELCSYGSLADIIRGYDNGENTRQTSAISLTYIDKLYLALGCAKGLSVIHDLNSTLCHRDVKSFNFLVDKKLNAKICDLELGYQQKEIKKKSTKEEAYKNARESNLKVSLNDNVLQDMENNIEEDINVEELLANWLAPEVIINKKFIQASDIYSLSIVIWEIISSQLPYENMSQQDIRTCIIEGYRHNITSDMEASQSLINLIKRGWSHDHTLRPTCREIVKELESIIANSCKHIIPDTIITPDLSELNHFYDNPNGETMSLLQSSMSWRTSWSANAKWNTPSFSIPSFSINNPINLDNSPGSLQPIKRLSSSKLPYDPHHHHTNHYIHKMVTPEVASIYHTILKDKIWSKFEEDDLIGDNVSTTIDRNLISFGGCWLIVTSKYPFIALHGTRSWHSLFGYSDILKPLSSSIIGLTELFDSDCCNEISTIEFVKSLSSTGSGHTIINHVRPNKLYEETMNIKIRQKSTGSNNSKNKLKKQIKQFETFKCSLHAFPIYKSTVKSDGYNFNDQNDKSGGVVYIAIVFNELIDANTKLNNNSKYNTKQSKNSASSSISNHSRNITSSIGSNINRKRNFKYDSKYNSQQFNSCGQNFCNFFFSNRANDVSADNTDSVSIKSLSTTNSLYIADK